MKKWSKDKAEKVCREWIELHPVGTPVRFHHIIDEPEFTEHTTRSHPYVSGSGHPVIFLNGYSGYVALEAVEAV